MKYFIILCLFHFYLNSAAQEEFIIIGNGGGVSGQTTKFKILRDGTVLKGAGIVEIKFGSQSKISRRDAKKTFKNIDCLELESFSHPGNMSYFVYLIKPGSEKKYTWGESNFDVPEELKVIYRETLQKISDLEFHPVEN